MPQAIAPFIAAALSVSPTVALVFAYIGTTLVTAAILRVLTPRPDLSSMRGTLANTRGATDPQEYVYGRVRKGGTITYLEATGPDNQFLHMIICLAGHECDAIEDIYVNDEVVTLDANGFVTSDPWASKIRIKTRRGTAYSGPQPDLADESEQIDATFKGAGICYLYVRLEYDQEVFATGLPLITAVVRGKRVFDPRDGQTRWSANAALCIRDYIIDERGLGDPAVDDTAFAAAADDCDDAMQIRGDGKWKEYLTSVGRGPTEPRYEINAAFRSNLSIGAVLEQMTQACGGTLYWSGGKWALKAGVFTAPVQTLTADDLRGPIAVETRQSMRDSFNRVTGTFNDESNRWLPGSFPEVSSDLFLAEDAGVDVPVQLDLACTTSPAAVQRLALQFLRRSREQATVSAEWGLSALGLSVGDVIGLTLPDYGWTAKRFEVVAWAFGPSSEGDLRVRMTLRETSSTAYAWGGDERNIVRNNTKLPDPRNPGAVSIDLSAELRVVNEQVTGVLMIDANAAGAFVAAVEVDYRVTGTSTWRKLGRGDPGRFEALGISDGRYDVRARAVGPLGYRGAYTEILGHGVTLFAPLPEDVADLSADVIGGQIALNWTPVGDLDLSHYRVRWSSLTIGASWQDAIDLVARVARPATSVVVPARSGTYLVKAVDKIGGHSVTAASVVVSTDIDAVERLNVVETITEHGAFSGAKTDTLRLTDDVGAYLTLDTDTLFDDGIGDFDDGLGFFDGGHASVTPTGYYEFGQAVDLGEIYTSRIRASIQMTVLDHANEFDAGVGLFDSGLGLFDGDPAAFDGVTAIVQVSSTRDDPASPGASWTAWQNFSVRDVTARGMRFRARLQSRNAMAAPAVRALSVRVDMPDRVERGSDLTVTGQLAVSYPAAFKAVPTLGVAVVLANGDRYTISAKTRTGFTITIFTGATQSTNPATLDYVAAGYGKETT